MAEILHQFPIKAPAQRVYQAVATPQGLDAWWTLRAEGEPVEGASYQLWFGSEYDWRAVVSRCVPGEAIEWEITAAHEDWMGTRVGVTLEERNGGTLVRFYHANWAEPNEHFQISSYCWATYLRLLKRYVERGEFIEYMDREEA